MRLQAVLFDMDGTLVDTSQDFVAVVQSLRQEQGLPPASESRIRQAISNGAQGMLEASFDIDPKSGAFASLREAFLNRYQQQCCQHSKLFEGMDDLLAEIEEAGLPWGIVTNKSARFAEPLLARLGLVDRCGALICPEHVRHSKPDPEPVLLACARLGVDPGQTVFVGDDKRDIQAGRSAGCLTLAAAYGYVNHLDDPYDWGADAVVKYSVTLQRLLGPALHNR